MRTSLTVHDIILPSLSRHFFLFLFMYKYLYLSLHSYSSIALSGDLTAIRDAGPALEILDIDGDGVIGLLDFIHFAARLKAIHQVQCMYSKCIVYVQCMYSVCTVHVQCMYSVCTVYV